MEKIIFWFLKERLKDNFNVIVDDITEQQKHLRVQGYSILLTHGTDIRSLENAAKQTM